MVFETLRFDCSSIQSGRISIRVNFSRRTGTKVDDGNWYEFRVASGESDETVDLPSIERCRIGLRLARPVLFPFEHGGVLRGLLSRALGIHELPAGLIPFPCESGRVRHEAGDPYAVLVTLVGDARREAAALQAGLARVGGSRPQGPAPVLGGNFVVESFEALPAPDLEAEAAALAGAEGLALRLLSPLRLQRPSAARRRGAGYLDTHFFPPAFFLDRVWRRLFFLIHGHYPEREERDASRPPLPEQARSQIERLVWSDLPVKGTEAKARPYVLGGARGQVIFEGVTEPWLPWLAAGMHFHVGQATPYGFGRFTLEGTVDAEDPAWQPASRLLDRVASPSVLDCALEHVMEGRERSREAGSEEEEFPPAEAPEDPPEDLVDSLARDLTRKRYRSRPLWGFVIPKDDGGVRPLAVPSLRDRVAQRAAVEVLAPALDTLLEDSSFAYRKGYSRQGAARAIERAYAEGYRYVLDADIHAFFDQVDWRILFAKLEALYPGEPLLALLREWVQAPVFFDGRRIERDRGLPQGSPVSPMLANLYLDSFDEALVDQGFRLVRFADDFVVLAKTPKQAAEARAAASEALARLRLELNEDETAIRSMDDGFSYLGYLFVRSLVMEQRRSETEEAGQERPPLEPDAIPAGSWLAGVPLARIEALVEGRRGSAEPARFERVPLAVASALGGGRWPLYVVSHGTSLYLRGQAAVIEPEGGEAREMPLAALSHVVFCGRVRATVPVLRGLARAGVPSYFCRADGELEAVFGPYEESWHLWLEQARAAADERLCQGFAAAVVEARLCNLATQAVRFEWQESAQLAAELRQLARECVNKTTPEALRGLEGRGTALAYQALAASLPTEWGFVGRARRPPPDPVNAMLSFGYSLLHNHAATALVEAGLSPRVGLFHQPRGAHLALASDLMEEMRHLVESVVWTLIRRRQLGPGDFRASADGRYPALLRPEGRKTFLHAFERRLMTELTPTGEEEPLSYRAFLAHQARQIRELILGRIPGYRPLLLER